MTVLELKAEIKKAIDNFPESRLQELLDHINKLIKIEVEKRSND